MKGHLVQIKDSQISYPLMADMLNKFRRKIVIS